MIQKPERRIRKLAPVPQSLPLFTDLPFPDENGFRCVSSKYGCDRPNFKNKLKFVATTEVSSSYKLVLKNPQIQRLAFNPRRTHDRLHAVTETQLRTVRKGDV